MRLSRQNRKHLSIAFDRGFTLLEVLVVMLIIGVLAAIAAPGWIGFLNNNRLSAAQSRVFSTLKEAESSAKRSGTTTTFTLASDPTNGVYATTTRSQAQYLDSSVQVLSVTQTSALTPISPSLPLTIVFSAQGLPTLVNGAAFTNYPLRITLSTTNSSSRKRCTTITTLLGSMKSGIDSDCDNP